MTTKEEKARRMEMRRKSGNRKIPAPLVPPSPRGGPDYLIAHACFACRKSFKIRFRENEAACPDCAGPLCRMGRAFKAPKKTDLKQWTKVQRLWLAGFRFFGYGGYDGAEGMPATLREVEGFIRRNPRHPLRITSTWRS